MATREKTMLTILLGLMTIATTAHAALVVRKLTINAGDIAYDPYSGLILVSAGSADPTYPNSVVFVDPQTAQPAGSVFAGSEPGKIVVSSDGTYAYVALNGSGKVRRIHIPTKTADIEFALGTSTYYGTLYAEDMDVQPGNSNVLAVSLKRSGVSPRHGGVGIYENGVKRSKQTPDHTGSNVIEFSDSPNILYGYNNETTDFGLRTMVVNEFGVEITNTAQGLISGFGQDIEYGGGYIFSSNGRVIDTSSMQLAGTVSGSGEIEPDTQSRRVFYISGTTIKAFDTQTFSPAGTISVPNVSGSAANLIRWGESGLAFSTADKLVILETDIVVPPQALTSLVMEGPDHLDTFMGQYKLTAGFADGVVEDVTTQAHWTCEPNDFAYIDGSARMIIHGTDQPGTVIVHAEYAWAGQIHEVSKEVSYTAEVPATGNLVRLEIQGPDRVLEGSTTQYKVVAFFDDNTQFDVSDKAIWSCTDVNFASLDDGGLLTAGSVEAKWDITLYAEFGHKSVVMDTAKTVLVVPDVPSFQALDWPMYQANAQHTGYIPISLEPDVFSLRWERDVTGGRSLNPIAAAEGKVFSSTPTRFAGPGAIQLYALDARDGEQLWSTAFGAVFSVNPPSYGYGNVYIQTGKDLGSAGPMLHAFNSDTGQVLFESTTSAQWESYYAPTICDGSVYINGGGYGGWYSYDAFSGEREWFKSLAQYDEWTPAVLGDTAYAYVGGLLTAADRFDATVRFTISDPDFDWSGWSMNLAPVIGGLDDVLIIHGGRLVCFDLTNRKIKYELVDHFAGQPTVAKGMVYVINNGALEVHDEATGEFLWTWTPPAGKLIDTMIVTDTHVLARTDTTTFAIELLGHQSFWSYPAAGHLALGNDTLYIAGTSGVLTAIATPDYTPASPIKLQIEGPDEVTESSVNQYSAVVSYDDERVRNRTELSTWTVTGLDVAAFDFEGSLVVGQLLYPQQNIVIHVEYEQDGKKLVAEKTVTVHIGCSIADLITRNVEQAVSAKQEILLQLEMALARERAAKTILKDYSDDKLSKLNQTTKDECDYQMARAILLEKLAKNFVNRSHDSLTATLEMLDQGNLTVENAARYRQLMSITFDEEVQNADVNGDGKVDMLDIAKISTLWLQSY